MKEMLQEELRYRLSLGQKPVSLAIMRNFLKALGYTLDRSMDCPGLSRYVTGARAGKSYPVITTGIREIDTRQSFAHTESRRDANFKQLQRLRFSGELFSVVRGRILEI